MKKKLVWLVVAAAVILGGVYFYTTQRGSKQDENVIKIGAILPLTGNLSYIGIEEQRGFDMAVAAYNSSNPKIKIQMVYEDSKGDPQNGVAIFNKMINIDKIDHIISSASGVTNALLPLASGKDINFFAITIQPDVTLGHNNVFRIWPDSKQEWQLLMKYITDNKLKNFGLYYVNAEYGLLGKNFFETEIPQSEGVLQYAEAISIGQTDFRNIIAKHKNTPTDRIIALLYPGEAINLVKQMRESNVNTEILSYLTFTYDNVQTALVKEADNTVFTAPEFAIENLNAKGEEFKKAFNSQYGQMPNWNVAFPYDIIQIIGQALTVTGSTDVKKLREEIRRTKNFEGITGEISIDANNDSKTSMYLVKLKDGKIEMIK